MVKFCYCPFSSSLRAEAFKTFQLWKNVNFVNSKARIAAKIGKISLAAFLLKTLAIMITHTMTIRVTKTEVYIVQCRAARTPDGKVLLLPTTYLYDGMTTKVIGEKPLYQVKSVMDKINSFIETIRTTEFPYAQWTETKFFPQSDRSKSSPGITCPRLNENLKIPSEKIGNQIVLSTGEVINLSSTTEL